jgi:hypothetical protein
MVHVSGDHWTASVPTTGGSFSVTTDCGLSVAGYQGFSADWVPTSGSTAAAIAIPLSLSTVTYDVYLAQVGQAAGIHLYVRLRVVFAAPCVAAVLPNPNLVEFSLDGGSTWQSGGFSAFNTFSISNPSGATGWKLTIGCDVVGTGDISCTVSNIATPALTHDYSPSAYSSSYPPLWTFTTTSGQPTGWPGTSILFRARAIPNLNQTKASKTKSAGAVTVTFSPSTQAHDAIVLAFYQNGTDVNGVPLAAPTTPSGYSLVYAGATKRLYVYCRQDAPSTGPVSITYGGNPDQVELIGLAISDPNQHGPGTSTGIDNHAGATAIDCPAITGPGHPYLIVGLVNQHVNSPTSQTGSTFSSPTGGVNTLTQDSQSVAGGTPIFEALSIAVMTGFQNDSSSHTPHVTSNKSQAYDAYTLVIREQ